MLKNIYLLPEPFRQHFSFLKLCLLFCVYMSENVLNLMEDTDGR